MGIGKRKEEARAAEAVDPAATHQVDELFRLLGVFSLSNFYTFLNTL